MIFRPTRIHDKRSWTSSVDNHAKADEYTELVVDAVVAVVGLIEQSSPVVELSKHAPAVAGHQCDADA